MIWGAGGPKSYSQNGHTYNTRKELIVDTEQLQTAGASDSEANDDLAQLHWKEIKVLVEAKGGTWTNKADAIVFLSK